MKRQRRSSTRIVLLLPHLVLTQADLLTEIASHLDEASLVTLCFTSTLTLQSVRHYCLTRKKPLLAKSFACQDASRLGHLKTLIWLQDNGCLTSEVACTMVALLGGHLHVLKWFYEKKGWLPNFWHCCHDAARNGHLEIVKWLHAIRFGGGTHDPDWASRSYTSAALGGHLHILKWLREEQACEWDPMICVIAARHGHLEILKWALESACPYRANLLYHAELTNQHEVAQWLRENQAALLSPPPPLSENDIEKKG